ncbi:type II toxin-antitoxin system VapC family toxin [Segnochrobactraceae bacterium EtOH-i3]
MIIAVDTNILVRVILEDDPEQGQRAQRELAEADQVIVPTHVLCEVVWLLSRSYGYPHADIIAVLRTILAIRTIRVDQGAIAAGLAMLEAGGDFADGVIAHMGLAAGADMFVSFDRKAVRLLARQGIPARLPA